MFCLMTPPCLLCCVLFSLFCFLFSYIVLKCCILFLPIFLIFLWFCFVLSSLFVFVLCCNLCVLLFCTALYCIVQYGGIRGNSIQHYLIELLNFILYNQYTLEPTAIHACLVDFSKALIGRTIQ